MWASERFRNVIYQVLLIALLAAFGGYIGHNLIHNLESRGITIGFSYLTLEAGFDISEKLIDYESTHSYGRAFIVGLLNTVLVSAISVVAASILGLFIGIARLSPNWLLRQMATTYVEMIRNVPLILQLLLWYGMLTNLLPPASEAVSFGSAYMSQRGLNFPWPTAHAGWWAALAGIPVGLACFWALMRRAKRIQSQTGEQPKLLWQFSFACLLPPILGWLIFGAPSEISHPVLGGFDFEGGKNVSPEFIALFLGLSLYTAAFIAEIVRGGILAVPKGQTEASAALGLSRAQQLRQVILPQALRVIIPPLTSQYLTLTKNSALAVAIGYPDLVGVSNTTLNQTGQAVEAIAMTMLVYLSISLAISWLMNRYNDSVKLVER